MPLTDLLDVYLADFGVAVTDGTTATTGILDAPGEVIANGAIVSVDYALTLKASDFPSLAYGNTLTVAGAVYSVRHVQPLDDGAFKVAYLSKV